MGLQKKAPLPSRLSGNKKTTTTIPANKTNTVTLFDLRNTSTSANKTNTVTLLNPNGTFNDSIFDLDELLAENKRREEEAAKEKLRIEEEERKAEEQRKLTEEQKIIANIAKEQEDQKNSITFFKTPSNEDFTKLMNCYKNLPHTLKNIEVRNMRSSYNLDLDLDDEDWEELELDADFEGVAIEAKRDGSEEIFLSLPMQKDFVDAINANTESLKEKYNTLRSRYIETIKEGNTIIEKTIKPFDEEYQIEYDNIVKEEHEFLFGDNENSIIFMFNAAKQKVIDKLVGKEPNPKDKEFKNEFKKLRKHLVIEVSTSNPTRVVTSIDRDSNGYIRKVNYKTINTKLNVTLKYPKKSGGDPKTLKTITVNLLDN
jgi:low affinity Fe/Cu permease